MICPCNREFFTDKDWRFIKAFPEETQKMKATEIEGWMRYRELLWLSKMARRCSLIIEVGTWNGRSTCAMAERMKHGKIITIDSFMMKGVPPGRWDIARKAYDALQEDPDYIFKCALMNLSDFIKAGRIEVIRGDSNEVHKKLGQYKGQADLVFIDGSHDYESVKRDIINYLPFVKPGGLITGHDFGHQVQKAVEEMLPGYGVARNTSIWYRRKDVV